MPKAAKEKPAAAKREKKVKDPNAPKKPLGAYMWFCKDMRGSVKEENPGMSVTEIGKRLGELWKEVSEEDKKKYLKQAEEDKERYNKEAAAYNKDGKAAGGGGGKEKAPAAKPKGKAKGKKAKEEEDEPEEEPEDDEDDE